MDTLIKFWEVVDNSRALQFTVEDMLGTNIPRTYKGAMAGYKYTGKINVPALIQEAIREFLTGPTMCVVPIATLALAKKNMGHSSNTTAENIRNLSHLAKTSIEQGNFNEESFFETVAKDLLKQTLDNNGEYSDKDVEKITEGLKKYHEIMKQTPKDRAHKKSIKRAKEEALNELQASFSGIIKSRSTDYKNSDFLNATYSISKEQKGSKNFKNYMEATAGYFADITKKGKEITKDSIERFRDSWVGKRCLVIGSMIGLTGICMSFIPKLYTLASGNINPNASAIYNEAKNQNTKPQEKGVK